MRTRHTNGYYMSDKDEMFVRYLEDECWENKKVDGGLRFPQHDNKGAGEVKISYLKKDVVNN